MAQVVAVEPARVALVAGGGAVKAYAFHAGVLRAMQEDGFHFRSGVRWQPNAARPGVREVDTYVGSSAGACVVAAMAAGREVGELHQALTGSAADVPTFGYRVLFVPVAPNPVKYLRRLSRRWRLGDFQPHHLLDVGGLFTTAGVERYFRRHVLPTNRFADLAARLYLVATQVNSSRKVVFGPTDSLSDAGYDPSCAYYDNVAISRALAAAVSVPPVFAPYGIVNPASGKLFHYYDGEVREPLSLDVARHSGARFVIASSIWRPYSYDESVGSLADWGMAAVGEQALHQMIGQKVEREREQSSRFERLLDLVEAHGARHGVPSSAREALAGEICTLLAHRPMHTLFVAPEPSDVGFFFRGSFRFGRRLVDRCVEAGYRAYRRAVCDSPDFLPALDQALGAGEGEHGR
ncbi:MAG: patatin-like phospholipase family protein [Deltaproteobacteria bacterium]|nr:patatin-like phospholipase family protein [Deltaproteobacteria bacterium]